MIINIIRVEVTWKELFKICKVFEEIIPLYYMQSINIQINLQ